MALGPVNTPAIQPAQPAPARDIRALQKAFFQAALGQVEAPAAAPTPPPQPAQPAAEPEPKRGYRPGSLLDIKV